MKNLLNTSNKNCINGGENLSKNKKPPSGKNPYPVKPDGKVSANKSQSTKNKK